MGAVTTALEQGFFRSMPGKAWQFQSKGFPQALALALAAAILLPGCKKTAHLEMEPEYTAIAGEFDFDGDGKPDTVSYRYTGGAHCCYMLRIKMKASPFSLPFEIEGGYRFGLDLSQPENFNIGDFNRDGKAEILFRKMGFTGNPHSDYKLAEFGAGGFAIRDVEEP
jgi:hypothetical protein